MPSSLKIMVLNLEKILVLLVELKVEKLLTRSKMIMMKVIMVKIKKKTVKRMVKIMVANKIMDKMSTINKMIKINSKMLKVKELNHLRLNTILHQISSKFKVILNTTQIRTHNTTWVVGNS